MVKVKQTLHIFSFSGRQAFNFSTKVMGKVQELTDGTKTIELGPIGEDYWIFTARSSTNLDRSLRLIEKLQTIRDEKAVLAALEETSSRRAQNDVGPTIYISQSGHEPYWSIDRWLARFGKRRGIFLGLGTPLGTIKVAGASGGLLALSIFPPLSSGQVQLAVSIGGARRVYLLGDQVSAMVQALREAISRAGAPRGE